LSFHEVDGTSYSSARNFKTGNTGFGEILSVWSPVSGQGAASTSLSSKSKKIVVNVAAASKTCNQKPRKRPTFCSPPAQISLSSIVLSYLAIKPARGSATEKPEHLVPAILYVGVLALSRVRKTW
jgi:hypothetical protein